MHLFEISVIGLLAMITGRMAGSTVSCFESMNCLRLPGVYATGRASASHGKVDGCFGGVK